MASPVLQHLREATAEIHLRLERRLPLAQISAQPAAYRHLLQTYWGFYAPMETQLADGIGRVAALQWDARQKAGLLAADLAQLGVTDADRVGLPRCDELPCVTTRAAALGAMYVLEGATLGGRQILKMQESAVAELGASRFLTGYGAATAEMWRRYLGCLEELDQPPAQAASTHTVVDSAVATFLSFESWLAAQGVLN